MNIKKGVKLLEESEGNGDTVVRQRYYLLSIRLSLSRGEVVKNPEKCLRGFLSERHKHMKVQRDGFYTHQVRMDRMYLIPGIFYTVDGMKLGGCRKVTIAPHLAYGDQGVESVIPPNAKLVAEIKVITELIDG